LAEQKIEMKSKLPEPAPEMKRLSSRIFIIFIIFLAGRWNPAIGGETADNNNSKCISVSKCAVASAHIEASRAGVEIMKQGGNAADAATAVAMALAVVYPQAGNLGGGGFLLYRPAKDSVYFLDFREMAPQKAQPDMFLDKNGDVIPYASLVGGLAVGVPGTVRGFYQFHRKFGRLSWKAVLAPAISLAEDGFIINSFMEGAFRKAESRFGSFPSTAAIFLPGGSPPKEGVRFYQKDLAVSLRKIAERGDQAFYEGEIAKQIANAVQQNGGIITCEDLKNYRAVERKPVAIDYCGCRIYAAPPPSSAGVVLNGILNSLSLVDFSKYQFNTAEYIALVSELSKHYFAFRNELLGDPDFVKMPLQNLTSPQLSYKILQQVDYRNPVPSSKISSSKLLKNREKDETTHFSVVDAEGNAISVTYTLNGNFGSYLVAGSTGILLNDEMDDFAIKPGSPNVYGLVQGKANAIEPGKRMLSSMSPVIISRNGNLVGVLGSPGGPKIISTVLEVLVNLIDFKMPLNQAIAAGRFHHQWLPDSIYYEKDKFSAKELQKLEQWGYRLVKRDFIGDVHAVWKNEAGWRVCSDPRGNGAPDGF
jgi:gamma-glutamyltranspeptidase/glutathione hydrolase